MIFPFAMANSSSATPGRVHPSQLYEAATEGLLLMIYTQWRWWSRPPPGQPGALPAGQLGGEFLILYAVGAHFLRIVSRAGRVAVFWTQPRHLLFVIYDFARDRNYCVEQDPRSRQAECLVTISENTILVHDLSRLSKTWASPRRTALAGARYRLFIDPRRRHARANAAKTPRPTDNVPVFDGVGPTTELLTLFHR